MKAKHLDHALESEKLLNRLAGSSLVMFLDYDGTLTPIVKRPEDAVLSDDMRSILEKLSQKYKVAIVSGRDKKDVQERVGLTHLIYAGSHGFDISGPDNMEMQHEQGRQALPELDQAEKELSVKCESIPGCQVERKKFSIAVHYRNADENQVENIKKIVADIQKKHDTLRINGGKMIFELQPDIEWDKGKAVLWLLDKLELNPEQILPVYIGDDLTDEHAFQALNKKGIAILVGDHRKDTEADYILDSVVQVRKFLQKILKI